MNVDRHKVTGDERRSMERIAGQVHALQPDRPAAARPGVPTLHVSTPRSAAIAGHTLRLDACGPERAGLAMLGHDIDRLARGESTLLVLEDMPLETNTPALLMLVGAMIGEVREYFGHGAPIVEISDKNKIVAMRPSSDNALHFDLHTDMSFVPDPPAFGCFLMLRTATSGGESLFCAVDDVVAGLADDISDTLQQPFTFPPPPHRPDDPSRSFPILSYDARGRAHLRYRRDGFAPVSDAQRRALTALEREADAHVTEIALQPGEMAIYSNTRVLHGRRAFVAERDDGHTRCALRAYADFRPST